MTTNKQSEKRQAPIMVIEGKTLKTLKKKENKMDNKPNYSLNKTIKSAKNSKKHPEYILQKNSSIDINLPNGMKLSLYSNKEGNFCSVEVLNFFGNEKSYEHKGNFETMAKEHIRKNNGYDVKTKSITSDNYSDAYDSSKNIEFKSNFKFEFKEFITK